ncbi:MAG: FAD-dependent oxidoreductase [Calditrichaeota bacterium]|nr:FAD-dependent oxidoreductase [Calditrichota bacterium]
MDLLLKRLHERIVRLGGEIHLGRKVDLIEPFFNNHIKLISGDINLEFDMVIATIPVPSFLYLAPLLPAGYKQRLDTIRYQAIICMIFVLSSKLSDDIYWLNINNKELPFGGIVEHTNFVPSDEYGGKNIVYVFNYMSSNDPMFHYAKDKIQELYIDGLKKVFPQFNERWIENVILSKSAFGTPIYSLGYTSLMPSHKTPIPSLYLANTAQIYPEDRNINNCIRNALSLTRMIQSEERR